MTSGGITETTPPMLCQWGKFRAFCFIARNEIYLKKIKSNKI
jgi:hypothetical protein